MKKDIFRSLTVQTRQMKILCLPDEGPPLETLNSVVSSEVLTFVYLKVIIVSIPFTEIQQSYNIPTAGINYIPHPMHFEFLLDVHR